jgi:hypothetical protein
MCSWSGVAVEFNCCASTEATGETVSGTRDGVGLRVGVGEPVRVTVGLPEVIGVLFSIDTNGSYVEKGIGVEVADVHEESMLTTKRQVVKLEILALRKGIGDDFTKRKSKL